MSKLDATVRCYDCPMKSKMKKATETPHGNGIVAKETSDLRKNKTKMGY